MHGRAALCLDGAQAGIRLEPRRRQHDRRTARRAQQRPEHHAEAVIHRHRHAQPVALRELHDARRHAGVVDDVVVRQRRRLGRARRAARELDVDRCVEVEVAADRLQGLEIFRPRHRSDVAEIEHAG